MAKRPPGLERETRAGGRTVWRASLFDVESSKRRRGPWQDVMGDAVEDLRAMKDEHARMGGRLPTDTLLRDFGREFMADARAGVARAHGRRRYRPSTLRGYERGWAKLEPKIGHRKLASIMPRDLQALVDGWVRDGWAPSTIRNTLDPLRAMYRRAVKLQLVPVNPTLDLDVPTDDHHEESEIRFASREEAQALLGALEQDRALWATALYAGLRRGELRALRVNDVDLGARLLKVRRSWDDIEGDGPTKSKAGRRDVAIIEPLRAELAAHILATGRRGDDLVFGETSTHPFTPSSVRRRARAAWKAAGVAPITMHQCRHTCASFMIAAGANAKALSVVLGHASISITFDRYGHLMPGGESEVGRLLEEWVNEGGA